MGNFPGGQFSGGYFSWGANFREAIFLGALFPGAFFRRGFFPGAFFLEPKIHTYMDSRKLKCKYTRQLFKKASSGREFLIIKYLAVIYAVADNYIWKHKYLFWKNFKSKNIKITKARCQMREVFIWPLLLIILKILFF